MILKRLKDAGQRDGFTNDGILVVHRLVKDGVCIDFQVNGFSNEKLVPWLVLSSSVDAYDVLEQAYNDGLTEIREKLNGIA